MCQRFSEESAGSASHVGSTVRREQRPPGSPKDEIWDVFLLDEQDLEPEPEYGDFWSMAGDSVSGRPLDHAEEAWG